MSYDISQSVSQGSSGEETAENRRIHEIADELRRRCQLYEAQLRDSQDNVIKMAISLSSMPKSQSIKIIENFCESTIRYIQE
jgi:hypothetical protein